MALAPDDAVSLAMVVLPGVYAWATTVALPAWSVPGSVARVSALGALALLIGGPWVARRRLALGRIIGVLGFVGLSAGTWGALGSALSLERLDTVRSALGAVAWGLFALGWGSLRRRSRIPEHDPRALDGDRFEPRVTLSRATGVAFGLVLLAALALPLLAWRVRENGVALFAHAVALAASIAALNVGSRLVVTQRAGVEAGKPLTRPGPRLFPGLLLAWLVLGLVLWLR